VSLQGSPKRIVNTNIVAWNFTSVIGNAVKIIALPEVLLIRRYITRIMPNIVTNSRRTADEDTTLTST
jgi:hypothetical protein